MITCGSSNRALARSSAYATTLSYRLRNNISQTRSFGSVLEPRYIFRAESLD